MQQQTENANDSLSQKNKTQNSVKERNHKYELEYNIYEVYIDKEYISTWWKFKNFFAKKQFSRFENFQALH